MNRLMKDLAVDRAKNPEAAQRDRWETEEDEEQDDDEEGGDIDFTDRSKSFSRCCTEYSILMPLSTISGDGERWPGQYIDVTRARRHGDEEINWPRPA